MNTLWRTHFRGREPLVLGVLVSGSGTNLQAIIDEIDRGSLNAKIAVVVSNIASAKALDRARTAGIPTVVLDHKAFADRAAFDTKLVETLLAHHVTCVVFAGFMRIVTSVVLRAFPNRVVNIHPSLLPAFPGVNAQAQAVAYGARLSGCTVHFVDEGTDTGPIIAQRGVPVYDDDDEASLRERILRKEHALLPTVLQWIADGRIEIDTSGDGTRARVRLKPYS
ncbi:MAG: phosphoribosylglycinamide formyltransferase [Polyangiaceae bacterium]|nr:phosphoribosylglycinamide formyltransferase [Polyangiaceae bacterium]